MIPLRDDARRTGFPLVNVLLILANLAVFAHELSLSPGGLTQMILRWGLVPAHVAAALRQPLAPGAAHVLETLVSAQFIHGGWLHIGGNMIFLWVFGDNVEDRMGHLGYLAFYLLVGVAGNVIYALANPLALAPTIGASGAIAGVLGAYLLSFPSARVLTVIFILFFFTVVRIRAVWLLLYWFLLQVLYGAAALGGASGTGGVAWGAHVGGFIAGMLLLPLFARGARARFG